MRAVEFLPRPTFSETYFVLYRSCLLSPHWPTLCVLCLCFREGTAVFASLLLLFVGMAIVPLRPSHHNLTFWVAAD